MKGEKITITVISDLHCKHTSSDKTNGISLNSTNLYSDLLRTDSTPKHPVHCLLQEIDGNKSSFKSDLLLCPGDITDKIDPQGYITGWSFLEEIRDALPADELYATIGNHDVDSRRNIANRMPFDTCRSIKYNYPIANKDLREKFWNDHFCIAETDKYLLLIFNSSYSHISSNDAAKAKISEEIIKKMEKCMADVAHDKIKIAMCHHHPISHSNITYPDADVIDKGEEFLEFLNRYNFTIIIHGHKHEIKIRYSDSLVVFGSGSFAAIDNVRETESDNVFHQIEIYGNKKGLIKTWIYGSKTGWQLKGGKFPPLCGFGFTGDLGLLAQNICTWFNTESNAMNDLYSKLVTAIPDVQFLMPWQQQELAEVLSNQYKIEITYNAQGMPKFISTIAV